LLICHWLPLLPLLAAIGSHYYAIVIGALVLAIGVLLLVGLYYAGRLPLVIGRLVHYYALVILVLVITPQLRQLHADTLYAISCIILLAWYAGIGIIGYCMPIVNIELRCVTTSLLHTLIRYINTPLVSHWSLRWSYCWFGCWLLVSLVNITPFGYVTVGWLVSAMAVIGWVITSLMAYANTLRQYTRHWSLRHWLADDIVGLSLLLSLAINHWRHTPLVLPR